MKIIVTGAAGFIGSHLVDALVEKKHKVFAVDDLSGGFIKNINENAIFKKLDLRDLNKTQAFIKSVKPEILFHLAADATEGRSQFTPISSCERNINAYINILVTCIKYKIKKVILTSSMSVYGSQIPPFSEEMPRKPDDVYGVAKTAMENITEILSKVHSFNYLIIRPHNVYGPRQNLSDPYRNVIGIFINCILNNKNFYIYGDGNQKRSFTYIDDLVPYMVHAAFNDNCNNEIFNLGPTEDISINDLADKILSVFYPKKVPTHLILKHIASRPLEVKNAYCTNEKANKTFGYKAIVNLDEGIKRMVEWAKTIGPQKFIYLKNELELENKSIPIVWRKKLL